MSTIVQYNGVELHNVLTREWHEEVVYDPSHTDKLYNKFRITVEGIAHNQLAFTGQSAGQYITTQNRGDSPANLAGIQAMIVNYLSTPRAHFKMYLESANEIPEIVLLEADGGPNASIPMLDTDNGPKPISVDIKEIVANKIFKVTFTIEVCAVFCDNIGRYSPWVLSNRWSVGESMDENFFVTRTIRGRMRLAFSTYNDGSTVPGHSVKYLTIPPLEDGFKRQSVDFIASENQLECEYAIVDRQIHKAPPWPATKMEVIDSSGTGDGLTARRECQVHLEGSPMTPSILLMIRAIQILELRLGTADLIQGTDYLVEDASFTNYIGEKPTVEARQRISTITKFQGVTAADSSSLLVRLIMACGNGEFTDDAGNMLLQPIPGFEQFDYVENQSPIPTVYGYDPKGVERNPANLFMLHCYLQTPCSAVKGINQNSIPSHSPHDQPGDRSGINGYQYPGSQLPEGQKSLYSTATQTAIYTYCAYESTYHTNSLRVQLPIARDPATANPEDPTCVVAQLGPKQTTREIVLHYERKGSLPSIPEPKDTYTDNGVTAYLLRNWETYYPPQLTNDGSGAIYRIDAHYLYALNRPPKADEPIAVGIMPYTDTSVGNKIKRSTIYGQDNQSVTTSTSGY